MPAKPAPTYALTRRAALQGAAVVAALAASGQGFAADDATAALARLEAQSGCRIGLALLKADGTPLVAHRADERFALCSTFKLMLVAAVLARSAAEPDLLRRLISYRAADLVTYSPITERHVATGLDVSALCAAALRYSDNTAANLLIALVGGVDVVTRQARSLGDAAFRLDRIEPALNDVPPGDLRDTTTPMAMARSVTRLLLGDGLPAPQRQVLEDWMRGNTTGGERIRAGLPADWSVADKTGGGSFGVANDVGVIWPARGEAVSLAIYTAQADRDAPSRSDVVAAATRIAASVIG